MALTAVLGSGMAGMGASSRFRQERVPHVVFEASGHPGGHTASHRDPTGFVFDEGPHISFTKDSRMQDVFAANVGGDYQVVRARVNNFWQGYWIKHPAQCNLHGLPTDLVVEIIKAMVEPAAGTAPPANYEEWLVATFGRPFAQTFPMQYGRKYHTTEASNMSVDWLGPRLYRPSIEEVLKGALSPSTPDVHYITEFRYPTTGGFVSFLRPFFDGAEIRLGHRLVGLNPAARTLTFGNGTTMSYDRVVSSVPLPELVPLIAGVPDDVVAAARRLACTTCVVVNVGIDRPDISENHWTYFYDDDFSFSRVSFPHMLSPKNAPDGTGSIQAEVYFSSKYKPLETDAAACVPKAIADLKRCGLIRERDRILYQGALHVPYANVIFDLERRSALATVHGFLDDIGVHYCGRYGHWGYQWTDEAFVSGEDAAQRAIDRVVSARS
jgi:protoporphyrinogen oxidase